MTEIIFYNYNGLQATKSNFTTDISKIADKNYNMGISNINEKDVANILKSLQKTKKKLVFNFNDGNIEFVSNDIKFTLKNKDDFIDDPRFSFIFESLDKYKSTRTSLKGVAVGLAFVVGLSGLGVASAFTKDSNDILIEEQSQVAYVDDSSTSHELEEKITEYKDEVEEKIDEVLNSAVNMNEENQDIQSTIVQEEVIATKEVNEYTQSNETPTEKEKHIETTKYDEELGLGTRLTTSKAEATRELYMDKIVKYSNMYGLDPNLICAIATQERGVHANEVDGGGAIGLMQIQVSVWDGQTITAYNYETESYDKINITLDKLRDVDFNIRVGCCVYQNYLVQMKGNEVAATQSYNMGPTAVRKQINVYANKVGKTVDEVLEDKDNYDWVDYITSAYAGDPEYVEHVLSYYPDNLQILNENTKAGRRV